MESAPTDLMVVLKFVCRGGYYPPVVITIPPSFSCENATSLYTREALLRLSPYNLVSPLLIVGDDILGVPFVRHNLTKSLPLSGKVAAEG